MTNFVIIYENAKEYSKHSCEMFKNFIFQEYGCNYHKAFQIFDNAIVVKSDTETIESIFEHINQHRAQFDYSQTSPNNGVEFTCEFNFLVLQLVQDDSKDIVDMASIGMRGMHLINFWNWLHDCQ